MARLIKTTGIECPDCGCEDNRVLKVRHFKLSKLGKVKTYTRRRRFCLNCENRWTTYERTTGK